MIDAEKVSEINMASSVELGVSMLEQLGNAFAELKNNEIGPGNQVPWNDVEAHFRNLQSLVKKKLEEVEAKEKEFTEKKTRNHMVLAEREVAVVAKEQDLLDKLQELKDAALAAISEAREKIVPEFLDADGNKVSCSVDDENASLDTQGKSPRNMGEGVEGAAAEVNPLEKLTQFCEQMDSIGLQNFVVENLKKVSSFWKEQLSVALGSATEPARLVLNALEGFFPPTEITQEGDAALRGMRQSCLILMEALSAFLSKADYSADFFTPEIQQQAIPIANDWKLKLTGESGNAITNGKSLEVEGFLRLLATFRIASEFDAEELCKYALAVASHRQATELCRSLDLTQKMPGWYSYNCPADLEESTN